MSANPPPTVPTSHAGAAAAEAELDTSGADSTVVQRFRTTQQIDEDAVQQALRADPAAFEAARLLREPTPATVPLDGAGADGTTGMGAAVAAHPTSRDDIAVLLTAGLSGELPELEDPTLPRAGADRYERHELIGKGGMGHVYRARDRALGRDVAMKMLQPRLDGDAAYVAALRREARIIGALEHPAIIPVHELGTLDDGTTYYTMKRLEGRSLADVVERLQHGDAATQGEFTPRRLMRVFVQVAQGLEFAHARGVIHRDLKPENVLLGAHGEVQIMDWGVAKRSGHTSASGIVIGTPAYMSPEQAVGDDIEVDARSDIYALGVMLYEVLALKRPYAGENPEQQIEAVKNVVPLPPSLVARDRHVPPELEAQCMRMLEKKKERRPQSMREVWEALDRFLAGDLERERMLERADQAYARGLDELARYEALRAEREIAAAEERALQRDVRPWHDQTQKEHVWTVRRQLAMLDILTAQAFARATELLREALVDGGDHTSARGQLAALSWHRHDEAAAHGDAATKLFFARQAHALEHEGHGHAGALPTGIMHIRSQPPGARIYAVPFDEIRASMGRPSPSHEVGIAPIAGLRLPLGPYVMVAHLDGHRDAMETVYIRPENRDLLLLCYPWASETPVIGRAVELTVLWTLLEDAELRSRPVTCLVAGAIGTGKNVLLDAFRRDIERSTDKLCFLLEVTCDRLHRDLPYSTVVDLVRVRAGILEIDTAEQARGKLRRMVSQAFSRLGRRRMTPERHAEADRIADTIAALPAFDIEEPARMGVREELAHEGRRALTEALARYFEAIAVATPVVMLVRNAQHMDPSSRAFFHDMLGIVRGSPVLVVASSTEADEVESLRVTALRNLAPHQPPFHFDEDLQLQPLSERAVGCLVREMLAAPVSAKLTEWVQAHALGNPFLAGELVHLLARLGAMTLHHGEWRLVRERLPQEVRPGDIARAVRALLQTLPDAVQRCFSTAVVVGAEFWDGALRHLGVDHLQESLDQLVQVGFIVRNASSRYPGEREYRLTSTLRRRVAYDLLPPKQRRTLHRKVTTWVASKRRTDLEESLRLAWHLQQGGQPEEAALLYARIGKAALTVAAEEEAERLFTQAYVLTGDTSLQGEIEVALRAQQVKVRGRGPW
ncbi:MAG: hypothetical protein EXR79_04010 [Myxococcales bacterium]|nr:hypothetical protein [Myxococcales bacterium]